LQVSKLTAVCGSPAPRRGCCCSTQARRSAGADSKHYSETAHVSTCSSFDIITLVGSTDIAWGSQTVVSKAQASSAAIWRSTAAKLLLQKIDSLLEEVASLGGSNHGCCFCPFTVGMRTRPQHSGSVSVMACTATAVVLVLSYILTPAEGVTATLPKLWHMANDVTYFAKTANFTQVCTCYGGVAAAAA
jgi:hypothetical protein